jgi:hypothetical protein
LNWLKGFGIAAGILLVAALVIVLSFRAVNQWLLIQDSKKIIESGGVSELVEIQVNGTTQYIFVEGKA